jgi:lipoyl(octanoyl) transferase
MHGFALNVNTNMDYFSYINPCGFIDKGVTSLEKELGTSLNMDEVRSVIVEKFLKVFDATLNKNLEAK